MTRSLFFASSLGLVVAASLGAQAFTSPAGYLTTEGSSNHNYILFARPGGLRWQQVDSTHVGTPYPNVRSIAWRRDGTGTTNTAYIARNLSNVTIVMAHSAVGGMGRDFDGNYTAPPTVVGQYPTLSLPDWTQQPTSVPDAWTVVVPFQQLWSYDGVQDLLWEVRYDGNDAVPPGSSSRNYGNDFQSTSGEVDGTSNSGTTLGTGCTATGQTSSMSLVGNFYNRGIGDAFELRFRVNNAPASTNVFVNIDFSDPNIAGVVCTEIHALPTISLPIGMSDATGTTGDVYFGRILYAANAVGAHLFTQALALDAGQTPLPVSASNGRDFTIPNDASGTLPLVGRVYTYLLSSGSRTWSGPWTGGIVTRFEY